MTQPQSISVPSGEDDIVARRKKLEDDLRESEERYRKLFELSPDGIIVYCDDHVVMANTAAAKLLARSTPDELMETPRWELIHPDYHKSVRERIQAVVEQGTNADLMEQRYVLPDGCVIEVEVTGTAFSYQGHPAVLTVFRNIDERKQQERALRESRARFQNLVDLLPQFIYEADAHGRLTFWNRSGLEESGYTPEDVAQGLTVADVLVPEDRERLQERLARVMAGERVRGLVYTLRRKDGTTLPIMASTDPIIRDNKVIGLRGVAFDISDLRRAEAALEESERKYRHLVEHANIGIVVAQDKWLKYVNPKNTELLGYSQEELLSKPFAEFIHPEDRPAALQAYQARLKGDPIPSFHSFRVFDKSGAVRWIDQNAVLVDWQGRLAVLSFWQDVTQRRQTEEALAQSEELLQGVFENMGCGLLVIGSNRQTVLANSYARACLGLTAEAVGQDLLEIVPQAAPLFTDAPAEDQQEMRFTDPDGNRITIGFCSQRLAASALRIVLFKDISVLLENEDRRRRAEQLALVGEMAARIGHEIKNPLSSILSGLRVLEKRATLSEEHRFVLGLVLNEVRSLNQTIHTLLDAARPASLALAVSPLTTWVESCFDMDQLSARTKEVTMELKPGPPEVNVIADERTMSRALSNLIQNALDACKRGDSVRVGWRVVSAEERDALAPQFPGRIIGIFVEDTGAGLPEGISTAELFRPFFTTKGAGTGLGLPVAQEIVELHGGRITANTTMQGLTRFEIFLPAAEDILTCAGIADKVDRSQEALAVHCLNCEVPASAASQFCWAVRGKSAYAQTGRWLDKCRDCPVFRSSNLSAFCTCCPNPTQNA